MLDVITSLGNYENGLFKIDENIIRKHVVENRNIFILKNIFKNNELKSLKEKVFQWGNEIESSNPPPEKSFEKSFHRIDNNPVKSTTGHIFQAYNITNKINVDFYDDLLSIANPMIKLQERLSGRHMNTVPNEQGVAVKPQFIHYPIGGGYFDWHEHSFEPQKIGLILSLSEIKVDFKTGGTKFKIGNKITSIEKEHQIGDIAIFRYDIVHSISPIDKNSGNIDFNNIDGKWSLVLPFN